MYLPNEYGYQTLEVNAANSCGFAGWAEKDIYVAKYYPLDAQIFSNAGPDPRPGWTVRFEAYATGGEPSYTCRWYVNNSFYSRDEEISVRLPEGVTSVRLIVNDSDGNQVTRTKNVTATWIHPLKGEEESSNEELGTLNIENDLKVYPNPAKDKIFIDGLPLNSVINIYDVNGKMVVNETTSNQMTSMDLSGLNAGLYILRIDNIAKAYRIIIE